MNSKRRLSIVILTTEFVTEPYFSGGIAQHFYRIAKYLVEQGHRLHVITLSHETRQFVWQGLHVYRICVNKNNLFSSMLKALTRHAIDTTIDHLHFSYACLQQIRLLRKKEPIDIVHCFNYLGVGLCSMMLAVPQVVTASSYQPLLNKLAGVQRSPDTWLEEKIEALQLRLSSHLYAPSSTLKKLLEEKLGKKNIELIRTPFYLEVDSLDATIYENSLNNKKYILFFGRLQIHKGAHIVGEALPAVFAQCPDLHAVFVGLDGVSPEGASMREYIKKRNESSAERLMFLNPLPHTQLYPVIAHARLVVLPSLIDNLPNTLLEAMGLHKPVIGTRGCSFDEMLEHGVSGFLVEPGNSKELSDVLISAWHYSDAQLSHMGRQAAKKVEELKPSKTVAALMDYYLDIVKP